MYINILLKFVYISADVHFNDFRPMYNWWQHEDQLLLTQGIQSSHLDGHV